MGNMPERDDKCDRRADRLDSENNVEHKTYEYDTLMSMLQVSVSKHLLDEHFTLVWANDFYYKMIGYPKKEYEKKFHNRPDLYYPAHGYEDELKKLSDMVIAALTDQASGYDLVTRLPVKAGGHVWVRMSATFADEYIDGRQVSYTAITNIDDLVRIQRDQRITNNNIPGFVARFLIKKDLRVEILDANDQFREFFGETGETTDFLPVHMKNWDGTRKSVASQAEDMRDGKPVQFLAQLKGCGGSNAWMQIRGECVDWINGEPVYLMIYLDVTDLTDLREMAQKLREALDAAEKANRAKSDFLSRMSHDIRTPMNAIVGMTEIASAHLDDADKLKDCLKKISLSSQHLLGLINDVLDMSRIESGKMALRNDSVFLPEVMENVVAIIQPMIKAKNQQFSIRMRGLIHEYYYSDSLRLRQCFINILSNASKFTPMEGRITVDVEEAPRADSDVTDLIFTFADSGIGISPEFITGIFDAFSREQDSRVDKTEGSGLGMAITKKIVDMMGGNITVESELGKGTVFVIRLPLRIDDLRDEKLMLPPLKVLVADDDEMVCEYAAQTLKECGVAAQWVTSGREALERITAAHQKNADFDAVILDWKMPDLDGLETVNRIRQQLRNDIPILIISAYDWTDIELEAKEAGVNGFLPKPLFRSTLCRGIYKYVLKRKNPLFRRDMGTDYDFSGKRILMVEDNELNREIARELLRPTGVEIDSAENGQEGAALFEKSEPGSYDLILMDIKMPVMDGYAATAKIRRMNRPDSSAIPIIAMTADAFAEDIQAAKDAGMSGHLAKPLDVKTMKKEIDRFLGQSRDLHEKYEFRNIRPEEAGQAAEIERICFPPNEACSREMMLARAAKAPELFLTAIDKSTGKIAGFLNGLSTDECAFRDEFFTDAGLHDPNGGNVMLLGLDVLPEYRGQGLAREIVKRYLDRERENGRRLLLLTCLPEKVKMYEKMGFRDEGIANSSWGGSRWHEMSCVIHE